MSTSAFEGWDAYSCDIPSALICSEKKKRKVSSCRPMLSITRTHPIALKARHELPGAVELAAAMQTRDLGQHLLQIHLRLLRLLPQKLDRPVFALAEERKEGIEPLVAGHARHALVLPFLWL